MKSQIGNDTPQAALLRYKERQRLKRLLLKKLRSPFLWIENRLIVWAFRRYCRETDQWDLFQIQVPWKERGGRKMETTYYVYVGLAPPPSFLPKHFRKIE